MTPVSRTEASVRVGFGLAVFVLAELCAFSAWQGFADHSPALDIVVSLVLAGWLFRVSFRVLRGDEPKHPVDRLLERYGDDEAARKAGLTGTAAWAFRVGRRVRRWRSR